MSEIRKKHSSLFPTLIWSVLVAFFVYQFIARSAFPSVLVEEFMKYFSIDANGIGTFGSCYYCVYAFCQIPAGIISDVFKLRTVAFLSILICATGVLLFIATSNFYVACLGEMLIGLGSSSAAIMAIKSVAMFFPEKKRSIMISYTISIGCCGPVIFGPLVALIVKSYDWKMVMMTFSLLGYVLALCVWKILGSKRVEATASSENDKSPKIPFLDSLKIVLSSSQLLIITIFSLVQYVPICALADLWGTMYIQKLYGADMAVSSLINNMIYLGMVIGAPFFSYLTKKTNSYKMPLCIGSFSCSIVFALIMYLNNIPIQAMFVLFFFTGFFSAALPFTLATLLFSKSVSATVSGVINMGSMISGIVFMRLIGYLMNLSWNGAMENGLKIYRVEDFSVGFLSVLVSIIVSFILSLLIKDRKFSTTNPKT
jgi:MFS family permease